MPPFLALTLWLVLLLGLLHFDPAKERKTSVALWVPLVWMFILASRLPSQWLEAKSLGGQAALTVTLEEGNPVDRIVFSILILIAVAILLSRSFQWSSFLARNLALTSYIFFALVSVLWSDFPYITFKHWFRDLGNYLAILVVLSDRHPIEAVQTIFRRLFYLLVPLSILLIKYFPAVSRTYDRWTGLAMDSGVATTKNTLGMVCLVSVLFFFWDTVTRWPRPRDRRTKRIIFVNLAFIAMSLSLLKSAHSATSTVCLGLGCLIVAVCHSKRGKPYSKLVASLIPVAFGLYVLLAFGFGLSGVMASAVGRDPTLTDRTLIWSLLLSMHTNPFLGTGYETFWIGPRLDWIWEKYGSGLNEAHNGYLEVYLNLGLIGLFLLGSFLAAGYRTIRKRLKPFSDFGSLTLALWAVFLFYNVTEAGFRSSLVWVSLLLGVVAVSELRRAKTVDLDVHVFDGSEVTDRIPEPLQGLKSSEEDDLAGRAFTLESPE